MNNILKNKIELLAPAGSLDKAYIALMYGADAVYVGGKSFSLRARASNFEIEDIKNLCDYAKKLNKKIYVTTNIIPHDEDFTGLEEYLTTLEEIGVTAIITSSLHIMKTALKVAPKLEVHVSTQMSITSSKTIDFWKEVGASRIVLARENTLDEIKQIMKNASLEVEVFIHGGMCSSYSGRCVLSNHMTLRDANRGGCAHSCRWNYYLYQGGKSLTNKKKFFNIGSKDLMAATFIPELIDSGVASLKIEGRMKSAYYLATVISTYRRLIDLYYEKHNITNDEMNDFIIDLNKAENRETSIGFFKGLPTINEQLYDTFNEGPTQEYIAYVLEDTTVDGITLIEQRNNFKEGTLAEAFGPNLSPTRFTITNLIDVETNEAIDVARHPLQRLYIKSEIKLSKHDMIRKVSK